MQKKRKILLNLGPDEWWQKGVRFECQGSGKCCVSHGSYGFVFLTLDDRKRFAKYFAIRTSDFTKKYCTHSHGAWHLTENPKNPNCMYLIDRKCSVYEARPTQCRTWPFWPEVMSPKTWMKDVALFCPGIGKGEKISGEKIKAQLLEQVFSERKLK